MVEAAGVGPSSEPPMNGMPLFSVVIPTHGRPQDLQQAVASVLAQTMTNFEIIVVDDAGEPPAPAVSDARVRTIRLAVNGGEGAARNVGIREARGSWVAFLDDDDLWYPQRLERISDALRANPSWQKDVITTDVEVWRGGERSSLYSEERPFHREDQLKAMLRRPFITSMIAAPRSLLLDIGGYDESLLVGEDADLLYRLLCRGVRVHLVPEALARYNKGSGVTADRLRLWSGKLHVIDKLIASGTLDSRTLAVAEEVRAQTEARMHVSCIALERSTQQLERRTLFAAARCGGLPRRQRLAYLVAGLSPRAVMAWDRRRRTARRRMSKHADRGRCP